MKKRKILCICFVAAFAVFSFALAYAALHLKTVQDAPASVTEPASRDFSEEALPADEDSRDKSALPKPQAGALTDRDFLMHYNG